MTIKTNIEPGELYIGQVNVLSIYVLQSDGVTPQPMTGWTLSFKVARAFDDVDLCTIVAPNIVISNGNGTNDLATVTAAASAIAADTEPGDFYTWSLRRTDSGNEKVLAAGNVYIDRAPG